MTIVAADAFQLTHSFFSQNNSLQESEDVGILPAHLFLMQ